MRTTNTNLAKWNGIAQQLKQCREAQRKTWGDIDEITVGRYLAGEANPDEIEAVESAMKTYPAVREAVELVRKVLSEQFSTVRLPKYF